MKKDQVEKTISEEIMDFQRQEAAHKKLVVKLAKAIQAVDLSKARLDVVGARLAKRLGLK